MASEVNYNASISAYGAYGSGSLEKREKLLMLCSHFSTREFADKEASAAEESLFVLKHFSTL